MGVLHVGFVAPTFQTSQSSPFQPVTVTGRHAASSDVHLRSPVRCFPSPVASFGLKLPWTLPLAFHPTVTSDAERDWEQALDTRLKAFASLSSCDLVSHHKVIRVPHHCPFADELASIVILDPDGLFHPVQGNVGQQWRDHPSYNVANFGNLFQREPVEWKEVGDSRGTPHEPVPGRSQRA